jgi:hypothetical protein
MRMVQTVIACTVVLMCSSAWATVYEWVDNKGIVNMTDNPDNVPARYRKVMKVRDIDAGESTAPDEGSKTPAPSPDAAIPTSREAVLYGGHNEGWWSSAFREARDNIKKLNDQIAGKKKNLEELHRKRVLYQKPSDRVAYYALSDEIAKNEEQVKALQKNLDDLDASADAAGVPQSWR